MWCSMGFLGFSGFHMWFHVVLCFFLSFGAVWGLCFFFTGVRGLVMGFHRASGLYVFLWGLLTFYGVDEVSCGFCGLSGFWGLMTVMGFYGCFGGLWGLGGFMGSRMFYGV